MPTIQDVNTRFVRELTEQLGERLNRPAHLSSRTSKSSDSRICREAAAGDHGRGLPRLSACGARPVTSPMTSPATTSGPNGPRERWRQCTGTSTAARPDAEPDWRAGGTVHQLRHVPLGNDRPSRRTALSDGVHGGYSLGNGAFGSPSRVDAGGRRNRDFCPPSFSQCCSHVGRRCADSESPHRYPSESGIGKLHRSGYWGPAPPRDQ